MITLRNTTVCRTPLDEGSARRRDLYLTTHNIHKKSTSMRAVGFDPTIPASARPQTYALDSAVIGIGEIAHKFSKLLRRLISASPGKWLQDFSHFECIRRQNKFVSWETFACKLRVDGACLILETASLTLQTVVVLSRTSCAFNYTKSPHFVLTWLSPRFCLWSWQLLGWSR
jgi:hypothetical protein